jgi:hypothetical protein
MVSQLHRSVVNISKSNRSILILYGIVYTYLLLQALLLPPINIDSLIYNLSRVMLMIKENSIILKNYSTLHQVNFVWGYDILYYLFLRNNSDFFLSIFSFLCYVVIIFSNYSLANRLFNNQRLALIVSLIISSLPSLVLQATSTKPDIGAAAVTMVLFLAGYNIIYNKDKSAVLIFAIASLLGISFRTYFPGFLIPFFLFLIVWFARKHSIKDILRLIQLERKYSLAYVMVLSLLFTLSLFFYQNYTK